MDPPRAHPPIFKIALSFLAQLVYRSWMLSKRKTVEIRLWEFEWEPPYRRVRGRYSHVVFRMVKPLRQGEGRTNIMATLGRTLGPFGDARAAHEAADQAGLKLGLTVEELEVYMTRERKIPDGPRKGELETRVVPVALFELLDVHETHDFECSDGGCNQAGFLPHKYTGDPVSLQAPSYLVADAAGSKRAATDATAWRGVAWRGVAWRGVAWRRQTDRSHRMPPAAGGGLQDHRAGAAQDAGDRARRASAHGRSSADWEGRQQTDRQTDRH